MPYPISISIGDHFSRLTVIKYAGVRRIGTLRNAARAWECRCECGGNVTASTAQLRSGNTKSCGCLNRQRQHERGVAAYPAIHGASKTPEFQSWNSMVHRCTNPKSRAYGNYGGRGIAVCDRWRNSFVNFLADMGPRPTPKHTIDRIDNNGPYSPDNCRWATRIEQARNTRRSIVLDFNGQSLTLFEWAERSGVPYKTLRSRVNARWNVERILSTPVSHINQK